MISPESSARRWRWAWNNDCTAATAGSVFGAAYGKDAIPEQWTRNFNNKAHSFIIGQPEFAIDDMMNRFTAIAANVHAP